MDGLRPEAFCVFCSELRWIQAPLLRGWSLSGCNSIRSLQSQKFERLQSGELDYNNPLTRKLALHHGDAPLPHRHPSKGSALSGQKKREEEEEYFAAIIDVLHDGLSSLIISPRAFLCCTCQVIRRTKLIRADKGSERDEQGDPTVNGISALYKLFNRF